MSSAAMGRKALEERFGANEALRFNETENGYITITVTNALATATIALQGAHLMRFQAAGEAPLLWLSPEAKLQPGKSIRGGVPICWPWFGAHETDVTLPAHGHARTVPWQLEQVEGLADGATRLHFSLIPSEATAALWPHTTPLHYQMTLGHTLELALVTRNDSPEAVTIGQALHSYFQVGDVRQVRVEGLDGCDYLDKVENFARKLQQGAVTIGGETDRIYLATPPHLTIEDPSLGRRIVIESGGSHSSVVWNPWIDKAAAMGDLGPDGYLQMLCVESANAAEDVVILAPGAEHRLEVRYRTEAI